MKTVAYDYDNQRWIEGDNATALRRTQLLDELDLLNSPRGAEYVTFIGAPSISAAITKCKAALAELSQ
jgi:hypothetical protein